MAATATAASRTAHKLTSPVRKTVDASMQLRELMDHAAESDTTRFGQAMTAKRVGKGLVTIGLIVVVLNEVFSINAINNSTGPFSGVVDTVESLGIAALTILTVGFIILAGAVAMGFMDSF